MSIIIVNWNSKDYLSKALSSIRANIKGIKYEIIVIDSASYDGCGKMLEENYPDIYFIQSDKNLGFAKANNEAFKQARGTVLLFINPDTEVEDNAIEILYKQLKSLPNAGLVGPMLLNSDKTIQETCIRAFPTILNQILESNLLRKIFPRSSLWGMAPLFDMSGSPHLVDAVSGACMMMLKTTYEKVGQFSEDYFMYSEDLDLCHKVRKAGYDIYYIPTAAIVHHGGKSSIQSSTNTFSAVMMLESRWRYFRNNRSYGYAQCFRVMIFGIAILRIAMLWLFWFIFKLFIMDNPNLAIIKKWQARLRWAIGSEAWVKSL